MAGGKREGAGRRPLGGPPRKAVTVYMSEDTKAALRQIGNGNLQRAIRELAADGVRPCPVCVARLLSEGPI